MQKKTIKLLRNKINKLDLHILHLLNERIKIIKDVACIKLKENKNIYVPERESEIYKTMLTHNKGPMQQDSLKAIYREIMSASLASQKIIKIAYFGQAYSFTHLASMKKFGASVKYISCSNITDVFKEVETKRCDYGVVPIENSTEGVITHTLDMFVDYEVKISSEIYLDISHNLYANCSSEKIRKIYSNPMVFGQCRLWLEANMPNVELREVASTTKAAEIASREKFSAAIASELAGKKYKLRKISEAIQDTSFNMTRFLVISKDYAGRSTKNDKTSIVFSIKDKVGALHDILVPFKKGKINLTKIESRPSRLKAWDYYFFVDMQGHYEDKKIKNAIAEVEKHCNFLKILGSYPKDEY